MSSAELLKQKLNWLAGFKILSAEWIPIFDEIIGILNKEEPVPADHRNGKEYCGVCGKRIPRKIKARYCHKCGQRIKTNVGIVRCEDCKHYWAGYCNRGTNFRPVDRDVFCAYGERKQ